MQKLVVLTGAGISAESGIPTFRGADGLWEGHDIYEVASPRGWAANQELVLEFYNQRRKQILEVAPNRGHEILADLQAHFDVQVITQNIDNLHERAGSRQVLHLHGEITKARSTSKESLVYAIDGWELKLGDCCELGSQLRPHIVWFEEPVPLIETAAEMVSTADIFVVVGTSLNVYPAAGLVMYAPGSIPKYIIDPNLPNVSGIPGMTAIEAGGGEGLATLQSLLLN